MRDLNEQQQHAPYGNIGWDNIARWISEINDWERIIAENKQRIVNGNSYSHDIPYIVRGQHFIGLFNNMIDRILAEG